ncbi:MAG: DUF1570 domain-containing protein [Pirellulaceae bacterium]|nr:DUF1570 domain-containing protein [Pirellulaceae bacterium]
MKHSRNLQLTVDTLMRSLLILSTLLLVAQCARAQGVPRWPDQLDTGPYRIHADFKLAKVPGLVNQLVKLETDVSTALQIGTPNERIELYLFQEKRSYQQYVSKYFPTVPTRQALYIKKNGPGMVFAYLSDDFLVDLRHETTHALLHANLPLVPLWLDEGLAEYFEVAAQDRVHGHRHLRAAKWKQRLGRLRRMEKLEAIGHISKMGKAEYEEAWSWVHFMLHGDALARNELLAYLADIKNLNPPGRLSRRLSSHVANLQNEYRAHVRSWPSRSAVAVAPQRSF